MSDLYTRSFEVDVLALRDDGRTVDGRILPYGEVALVSDGGEPYRETFLPGALTRMVQTAKRRGNAAWIALSIEHDDGLRSRIGYASELREDDGGGYATFRLYDSDDLTKVRSMLSESHTGLSVGFRDLARPRNVDGVTARVQIHLDHVAATPVPCYVGAGVLSVRSGDGESFPTPQLDDVRAFLRARDPEPPSVPEPPPDDAPPEEPLEDPGEENEDGAA